MKLLRDFRGAHVRLTDERLAHIFEHPEMAGMETAIEETLSKPERVVQSASGPEALLYYRFYTSTRVGGKFLCVVVKSIRGNSFILTAYLTDKMKLGESLWNVIS